MFPKTSVMRCVPVWMWPQSRWRSFILVWAVRWRCGSRANSRRGHCCAAALDLSRSKCNKAAFRNRWERVHRRHGSVSAIGPSSGDSSQGVCAETCLGDSRCNCFINDTSWINDWPTQCSTRRECGQVPFARVRSLVCALNPCGCHHVRLSPASRHLRICAFAS